MTGRAIRRPGHLDQTRAPWRALSHTDQSAESAGGQCCLVEHLDVDRKRRAQRRGTVGETAREEIGRGSVDEVTNQVNGFCGGGGTLNSRFRVGSRTDDHDLARRSFRGIEAG